MHAKIYVHNAVMGVGVRGTSLVIFIISFLCVAFFAALPGAAYALVNINTADATTLETLNGIGPSKANAIIQYRTDHGAFGAIEDIQNVSGIGPATFNNIKDYITVSGTSQTDNTQDQQSTTTAATSTDPQTQTKTQSAPVDSYVPPPSPTLFADAGGDRTVIVGADTQYTGRAYDREQKTVSDNVRFTWNFGDGSTAEGESVLHHFSYPGRYAVFLYIAQDTDAELDEIIVTAEPARLSFETYADGSVSIGNDSGHDLDLSGWLVRQFGRTLALPGHSLILAGESLRIPHTTLNFWANADAELDYPNGDLVLHSGANSVADIVAPVAKAPPVTAPVQHITTQEPARNIVQQQPSVAPNSVSGDPSVPEARATDTPATSSQVSAAGAVGSSWAWWLAAMLLALAAGGALVAARYAAKGEWDIVEEKG